MVKFFLVTLNFLYVITWTVQNRSFIIQVEISVKWTYSVCCFLSAIWFLSLEIFIENQSVVYFYLETRFQFPIFCPTVVEAEIEENAIKLVYLGDVWDIRKAARHDVTPTNASFLVILHSTSKSIAAG